MLVCRIIEKIISFESQSHSVASVLAQQTVSVPLRLFFRLFSPLSVPILLIHTRHSEMITIALAPSLISMQHPRLQSTFQFTKIILWLSLHLNQPRYSLLSVRQIGLVNSLLYFQPSSPSEGRVELVQRPHKWWLDRTLHIILHILLRISRVSYLLFPLINQSPQFGLQIPAHFSCISLLEFTLYRTDGFHIDEMTVLCSLLQSWILFRVD